MSATLVVAKRAFEISWINSTSGSTAIRMLPPRGTHIGGTMVTDPSLPITGSPHSSYGLLHHEAAFDCPEPSVLASLQRVPGMGGIMGIAFTWHGPAGNNGSGHLLAGVKLVADDLPDWASGLPDELKSYLANMTATMDSMRRLRLFAVIDNG